MNKEELLIYEAPFITEFISNSFLQYIIAKYMAWNVNRKWKRYQHRLRRNEFIKSLRKEI